MPPFPSAKPSKPRRRGIAMRTATPWRITSDSSSKKCWRKAKPADAFDPKKPDTMTHTFALWHWSTIGLRAVVVAGALAAWFWTQSLIARKSAAKEGIGDIVHDLTAGWHRYFATHDRAANLALIISSIFIDVFGLSLIGAAI